MKKWKFCTVSLLLFSLLITIAGCTIIDERAVGTVDNEQISIGEYQFFLNSVQRELLTQSGITQGNEADFWANSEIDGKKAVDVARDKAFEQAVLFHTKLLKATQEGVTITAEDKAAITTQFNAMQRTMGGAQGLEEALKEIGITVSDYKKILEKDFQIQKYLTQLASDSSSPVAVTDEQVQQYYDQHKQEADYKSKVTAKHILFSTVDDNQSPLPAEQIAAAKEKADQTYEQIMGGADFDKLMNELSQDPGLATNPDGYTFGKGEMVKEFENAAFSLDVNQVSKPVQSSFGYHIIKTTAIEYIPFDSIKDTLKSTIQGEQFDKLAEGWKADYAVTRNDKLIASIEIK